MKKLVISSLSFLLLSTTVAPAVKAQSEDSRNDYLTDLQSQDYESDNSSYGNGMDMYDIRRTEAFDLVRSAYRGEFEEYGIPSYAQLVTEYQSGQVTSEGLIEAAVEAGQLSPLAQQDEGYVNAVELQLEGLSNQG